MNTTTPDLVLGSDSDGAALAIAAAINNLEEANDPNRYSEIERKIAALNAVAHAIIGLTFTLDARLKLGTLRPLGPLEARVNKS